MKFTVGIGCRRGVSAADIAEAVDAALDTAGISAGSVGKLASCDVKADEAGLLEFAAERGWEVEFIPSEALAKVDVRNPSARVDEAVGSPSVSEAAAVLASGEGTLILEKTKKGGVTVAIAAEKRGTLFAVGLGPGSSSYLTPMAMVAMSHSDAVVGYDAYIALIANMIEGKEIVSTGMGRERERCEKAIALAKEGKTVSIVSSGDAGIYGMAGLVLELMDAETAESGDPDPGFFFEVVPGITAASAAAAVLGAPLMNDFAVVSLSDLMTPVETIKKRVSAVARAGMACAIYNPKSKRRVELLKWSLAEFAEAGGDDLACGYVKDAGRDGETKWLGKLSEFPFDDVGMTTVVVIGSENTYISPVLGKMVTPRGYREKKKQRPE